MNDANLQAIKDILEKDEAIGIVVGKNPSLDDMGAALAFYLSLKQLNKNVSIACPTEPTVELSPLVGINKVKRNLDAEGGDLMVSFPYREGEIEKVSYTLDNGYLNIVVKAGDSGLSFAENEIKFKRGGAFPKTLFIIGTHRLSDLGNLFDPEALKDTTVVNIDNKANNQGFGDVVFVSQEFSSVCEQIANLFNFLRFNIDIDIAQNLISGISFATNNFQDPKTSSFAFETAAILMRKGAMRPSKMSLDETRSPASQKWGQDIAGLKQKGYFKPVGSITPSFPQRVTKQTQPTLPKTSFPKRQESSEEEKAPADWLAPKIYKGSTSI